MPEASEKVILHRYLRSAREAILWKLEDLSEYDLRRPLVPTGTNLLGLIKHLAGTESGYFGQTFDRPFPERLSFTEDTAEPNADMWATADESPESIIALYRRVAAHSDATIEALELDAPGRVAWWHPDRASVTLQQILVHMIVETNRHAGHADIVRELIDGEVGLRRDNDNLPRVDREWWGTYRDRLEQVARTAGEGSPSNA